MREVIARLVDGSEVLDFKPSYGAETVCCHAAIDGRAIGVIGNNGPIDSAGSSKAGQFIQLCCQADLPILFLQNTTGYLVGVEAESSGIVKHGSKMIQAVTNADAPKLTLQIGGSFGAGHYGMCGRAFGPRFLFSWPNARVAVMGGEQAAKVMAIVAEEAANARGLPFDAEKAKAQGAKIVASYDRQSTALFATARLWDDGLIDPRDSRATLAFCLATCAEAESADAPAQFIRRREVLNMSALLRVHEAGRRLRLTLDDPRRQNALSAEMVAAIGHALDAAPPGLAAVIVDGAGGAFSAGADLKSLSEALAKPPPPGETDPLQALNAAGGRFLRPLRRPALRHHCGRRRRGGRRRHGPRRRGRHRHRDQPRPLRADRDEPRAAARTDRALPRPAPRRAHRSAPCADGRAHRRAGSRGARPRRLFLRRRGRARGEARVGARSRRALRPGGECRNQASLPRLPRAVGRTPMSRRPRTASPTPCAAPKDARAWRLSRKNARRPGRDDRHEPALLLGPRRQSRRDRLPIIRAARAEGLRTVAVFSDADAEALHVRLADGAVRIGPAPSQESYLSIDSLIAAAKAGGAEAVHPGYGFLAENAGFAEACASAGLVFVGPPPAAIRAMGDKAAAKALMEAAGVPCVPGYHGDEQSPARFAEEAERIGYPVIVKASAGGGGRGMRIVRERSELVAALSAASAEAEAAFGDGRLILERALAGARHVEIQVFGDERGSLVHLCERDCSIQRRHQKLIEEAPSPVMTPELRASMGAAAVKAAEAVFYVGAGTVEFLLASDGWFYFLEMNTRIQVEHPVTECVTGVDCVRLQFQIAEGRPLPFDQSDVALRGHAIEARLYAEDPAADFLPSTGRIAAWRAPEGDGVRVDCGVETGATVSPVLRFPHRQNHRLRRRPRGGENAARPRPRGHFRRGRDDQPRPSPRRPAADGFRRRKGDNRFHPFRIAERVAAKPDGDRDRRAPVRRARRAGRAECGLARVALAPCGRRSRISGLRPATGR